MNLSFNQQLENWNLIKGIAITCVVIGHCTLIPFVEQYVNQYHLAVFFFVSGYFFKEKCIDDKRTFVWKKIKRLYLMFVISGLVFLILYPVLEWLNVYEGSLAGNEYIMEVFNLTIGLTSNNPMMGAMWFCPALLMVSLISFGLFVITWGRSIAVRTAVFCAVVSLGGGLLHVLKLKSPYCIWQNMIVVGIYYVGWLFHQKEPLIQISKRWIWLIIALILFTAIYIVTVNGVYARLQPANIKQENLLAILLIAAMGCMMIYAISKVLSETILARILAVLGDYSFSIMLLHFLCFKLVNFLYCIVYNLPSTDISLFPTIKYESFVWFWIYLLIGLFGPVILSKIYSLCKEKLEL